ncbi:hypothetical protein HER32_11980 [Hymenobacter sp. BT18]|uniref:hypothetical protein n=1 Tax=Hymenobacter sp. BT18 TaxID=2835648 RepID=UPI00143EA8C8|nr:hypothetical protein [Hymenobacter sp. BT18]QIX61861.1 hypothetical protein HER32_11980 [Hymenobacter sp. BT18]
MSACALNLSSLLPSCEALNKPGGTRDFLYTVRKADITSVSRATDGTVTGVTVTTGALKKHRGRKFQNKGDYELQTSATGVRTFLHKVTDRLYHDTQVERTSIEALANVEDLVVFLPTNASQIEIYGLDLGLSPATGKGGTGVALGDDNTFLFEFQGSESKLPVLFQAPNVVGPPALSGIDASVAFLDDLVGA